MGRLEKAAGERGLYHDPNSGMYYVRVYYNGRDTYRSLGTTRIWQAREGMDARRAAKAAANLGMALEPDAPERRIVVEQITDAYEAAGFPDKRGRNAKGGPHRRTEQDNCNTLSSLLNYPCFSRRPTPIPLIIRGF